MNIGVLSMWGYVMKTFSTNMHLFTYIDIVKTSAYTAISLGESNTIFDLFWQWSSEENIRKKICK